MSVATKNPFAILEAEDSSRPATPPAAAAAPAPAPAPAQAPAASRGRGPAARGGKYYQRGGAAKSGPREPQEDAPAAVAGGAAANDAAAGERSKRKPADAQGRGFVRGRGRGGRGRGGERLDRHSATGKTDSDKKVHQSWGGDDGVTELKVEEAAQRDAAADAGGINDWGDAAGGDDPWAPTGDAAATTTAADQAAAAEGDKSGEQQGERPPRDRDEPEDKTLTLDQYLAQKKEHESSIVPKLEGVRKANEGADASIWKDVVEHKKGQSETAYFPGKERHAPKPRTKKEDKTFIEIEGRFDRPARGGRGGPRGGRGRGDGPGSARGERGRGRGGGERRGYYSGPTKAPLRVDDEVAFPSLS